VSNKEKARFYGMMVVIIKVNFMRINSKGKVHINGRMEDAMKEIG